MISKKELFFKEREEIFNKIIDILELTNENNWFYLDELDNDDEKKNAINELIIDIRKFFNSSSWGGSCEKSKRSHMSLIKNVVKSQDRKIYYERDVKYINKKRLSRQKYIIEF